MKENSKKIIRITNIIALAISTIAAAILPLVYFGLSYQHESAVLENEAENFSDLISGKISSNPVYWRYEKDRLDELLTRSNETEYKGAHRIVDLKGGTIASNSIEAAPPVISRSHDLFDAGNIVARVEVVKSARPLLKKTFTLSVLGFVIGFTGFYFLRTVPLRAFAGTLTLLYESEEKFRAITSTAVDGIIVMDNKGSIVYWNPAAEKMFGYGRKEVFGRDLHLLIAPGEFHEQYRKGFESFSRTGQGPAIGRTLEFMAVRKDGTEFPIEVSTSAIRVKEEWHAVGLIHDITARKDAEKDLAEMYEAKRDEAEISGSLLQLVETLNSSLDEKELVRNVLNIAPAYLKFDRVGLFFYEEERGAFKFTGCHGLSPETKGMLSSRTLKAGDFPALDMIIKGETVIMENARESKLLSEDMIDMLDIKSAVMAPISFRGSVSGFICADYTTIKSAEQKDLTLLKGLADGIGIALQNSKLYRESNQRLAELTGKIETIEAMAQLDREILSTTIDKTAILRTATALTGRLIPCDRVAVLLKEKDRFRAIMEWGLGEFAGRYYDLKDSHFSAMEARQGSLLISDISMDCTECSYHREQIALGIRTTLIIPLISKGEMQGLLDVGSSHNGRLTSDHISTAEKIAAQITVALENARLYEDLEKLLISTTTSLISIIDAKSPWTKGHSERVTEYAVKIAREMGLKEKDVNHIRLCGILHDIGKIGTFDGLLDKPGKLTEEEYEVVKKHPEKGAEIIAPIKQLNEIIPGVLHHHERYDGKGYPLGIRGDDIPLCASILAVADSFDSMTADRPYRKSPGREFAVSELKRCSGTQFNPKIVKVFLSALEKMEGIPD
ncbi:MAG: PAS domain S-box protein [Nitrospirae bacterium]|nr:PAS domain S-box protein [Nitrospirota bacterium]